MNDLAIRLRKVANELVLSAYRARAEAAQRALELRAKPIEPWCLGKIAYQEARVKHASEVIARASEYFPESNVYPDCPFCWLETGTHSSVAPVHIEGRTTVICRKCGSEYPPGKRP